MTLTIGPQPLGSTGPRTVNYRIAAVSWLCSDQAAFVTGHAMIVDGGQTL